MDEQPSDNWPFRFNKPAPSDPEQVRHSWQAIYYGIAERTVHRKRKRLMTLAVSSVILLLLGYGIWTWQFAWQERRTNYGNIERVTLPDGSVVVLSAHSSLRFPPRWNSRSREVWLSGEAYFEVTHTKSNSRFIVHSNDLRIEVLGTRFNVNNRTEKASIALNEGKVQLSSKELLSLHKQPIMMAPGDVVEIKGRDYNIKHGQQVERFSNWTNHSFHFNGTSMAEVAVFIQRYYGMEMQFADPSLQQLSLSGDLKIRDINQFLRTMEVALHIKTEVKDQVIFVYKQ